jgi:protein-disulfide isomerase
MATSRHRAAAARSGRATTANRRPLLVAAAVIAGAGFVLAALLARQHSQAHAGIASFCAIDDVVNCDRVALSRYSVVLGLPVAVWGMLGYGIAAVLALAGLRRRKARESWPVGLLLVVSAAAVAASFALALVSKLAIGALCLLCAGSWVVSVALLMVAWRACRPEGVARAVGADLAHLRERPARAAGVGLAGAAAVVLLVSSCPRYWEKKAGAPVAGAATTVPAGGQATVPAPPPSGVPTTAPAAAPAQGSLVVVEFSDYQCPFCAQAHAETKALLAVRPSVTLVRRHFPLDSECNRALTRRVHPEACGLARAGICAEQQGKLPAMDDALFENQKEKLPVETIAAQVGLDVPRFKQCLAAPETEQRLRADVEAGIRAGLQATPTYVVGGRPFTGRLPVELLPPAGG